MRTTKTLLAGAAISFLAGAAAAQPIGEGLVMYMQMGGNPGDGATLARQTGAARPPRRSASISRSSSRPGRRRR